MTNLFAGLSSVVAYTTWPAISADLRAARDEGVSGNESINACVDRLVDSALNAIDWHGNRKGATKPATAQDGVEVMEVADEPQCVADSDAASLLAD